MSKIFTKAELQSIKDREEGNKSDKTGMFSNRVRPKINELLSVWFPRKKKLEELVKRK